MLKITGSSHNREPCNERILFGTKTSKYGEQRENDSANKRAQDNPGSPTSPMLHRNAVLKAYGIVLMAVKERSGFSLPLKETKRQEYRGNEDKWVRDNAGNQIATERPSDHKIQTEKGKAELKSKQYKQMVLKAYGVLPVQEYFSVL